MEVHTKRCLNIYISHIFHGTARFLCRNQPGLRANRQSPGRHFDSAMNAHTYTRGYILPYMHLGGAESSQQYPTVRIARRASSVCFIYFDMNRSWPIRRTFCSEVHAPHFFRTFGIGMLVLPRSSAPLSLVPARVQQ